MLVFGFVMAAMIGVLGGMILGRNQVTSQLQAADNPKLLGDGKDVIRGAVSEISQSIWEDPDSWVRVDEDKIGNKHSGITIWIGNGQDGVEIEGTISISDLWDAEQEMLWEAAKFLESNQIKAMLQAPPVKLPDGMKKDFFKTGEKIGRKFVFDEEGKIVPVNP